MDRCFICGDEEHEPRELHVFWSRRDALGEAAEYDRRAAQAGAVSTPSMSAVETLDPREAVYA